MAEPLPVPPFLSMAHIQDIPPDRRWYADFNPNVERVLDVQLAHTLMHESVVCCVRFSADGKYLATGCNWTAQIYDTETGTKTCVLTDDSVEETGDLYIRSVCFSPDGKLLATGADDKLIRIWEIEKEQILRVLDGHQEEIYSLDFSLDGKLIVSGSADNTAMIWNIVDPEVAPKVLAINETHSREGVTSVAFSPTGQLVATGSLDNFVYIWDVATGRLIEKLRGHRDSVFSVAFTPDGKGLVSGSLDKKLKLWDVSELGVPLDGVEPSRSPCSMEFRGHQDYVLSVAVSHDGQWIASGSKDRGVVVWDADTAETQCTLQGHRNSVITVDLSPVGGLLATGSGDWQATIWSYGPL